MNKKHPIETEQELLKALEKFVYDVSEDEPIENIDAELQNLGYDPHAIGAKFQEIARQALADSPLNWRNKAPEVSEARDKLELISKPKSMELDKPSLIEAIKQSLRNLGYKDLSLVPTMYRNFEQATESDLISLLQQLEYLSSKSEQKED